MADEQARQPSGDPVVTAECLGPLVPRRGTAFSQRFGELWLRAMGWKVTGTAPTVAKAMFIGAPHTSNRDGFVAAAVILALRLRITVMAKAELFKGPVGSFFRWAGVMPVYRSSAQRGGQVEQVVANFESSENIYIGIAPEGTRHASEKWKSGFYHMAVKAGVPILPFILDFGRKELRLTPVFHPTGDLEADMKVLMERYRGVIPADPTRLSQPLRKLNGQ